jgi:uncharacterized sodium:solute symporter family permease YidK
VAGRARRERQSPVSTCRIAITALALFALLYALYGGLKAVALTDVVQVSLLVLGGVIITWMSLDKVGGDAGVLAGFRTLTDTVPRKVRHDPFGGQSPLQGSAGPRRVVRRHVG